MNSDTYMLQYMHSSSFSSQLHAYLCSSVCMCVCVCMLLQPLELICEKAIATCNRPLGAGEALRRVMECLASGILLPGREPQWLHKYAYWKD